ncbi:MAG TPA: polysaccharide biosynthesis/export family protein [Pyrinomonadaceae bacterium]|nr:polysaccharide biosynthesis/export family protein [Pyrinomonadaceae bacterium]
MNVKRSFVVAVGFACVLAGRVHAQQEPQQQTSAPDSAQSSSMDIQGIKAYLLGPGDVLDVRVFGQPELTSTVQVDSDGNLSSLPFLETPIRAKCRSDKEIQKDIAAAYSKFINNPQVSVRISE